MYIAHWIECKVFEHTFQQFPVSELEPATEWSDTEWQM
jgi:hypothetical protein